MKSMDQSGFEQQLQAAMKGADYSRNNRVVRHQFMSLQHPIKKLEITSPRAPSINLRLEELLKRDTSLQQIQIDVDFNELDFNDKVLGEKKPILKKERYQEPRAKKVRNQSSLNQPTHAGTSTTVMSARGPDLRLPKLDEILGVKTANQSTNDATPYISQLAALYSARNMDSNTRLSNIQSARPSKTNNQTTNQGQDSETKPTTRHSGTHPISNKFHSRNLSFLQPVTSLPPEPTPLKFQPRQDPFQVRKMSTQIEKPQKLAKIRNYDELKLEKRITALEHQTQQIKQLVKRPDVVELKVIAKVKRQQPAFDEQMALDAAAVSSELFNDISHSQLIQHPSELRLPSIESSSSLGSADFGLKQFNLLKPRPSKKPETHSKMYYKFSGKKKKKAAFLVKEHRMAMDLLEKVNQIKQQEMEQREDLARFIYDKFGHNLERDTVTSDLSIGKMTGMIPLKEADVALRAIHKKTFSKSPWEERSIADNRMLKTKNRTKKFLNILEDSQQRSQEAPSSKESKKRSDSEYSLKFEGEDATSVKKEQQPKAPNSILRQSRFKAPDVMVEKPLFKHDVSSVPNSKQPINLPSAHTVRFEDPKSLMNQTTKQQPKPNELLTVEELPEDAHYPEKRYSQDLSRLNALKQKRDTQLETLTMKRMRTSPLNTKLNPGINRSKTNIKPDLSQVVEELMSQSNLPSYLRTLLSLVDIEQPPSPSRINIISEKSEDQSVDGDDPRAKQVEGLLMMSEAKKHLLNLLEKGWLDMSDMEYEKIQSGLYWNKVAKMEQTERTREIFELNQKMVREAQERTEEAARRFKAFLKKVKRDIDYPIDVINEMITIKVKELERIKKKPASQLVEVIAEDDLVTGLCLLYEIINTKDEDEDWKMTGLISQRLDKVEHAMRTIKNFQNQTQNLKDEFHNLNKTINFEKLLNQSFHMGSTQQSFRRQFSGVMGDDTSEASSIKSGISIARKSFHSYASGEKFEHKDHDLSQTKQEWFQSTIYNEVLQTILGHNKHVSKKINKQDVATQQFARFVTMKDQFAKIQKFKHRPMMEEKFAENPFIHFFNTSDEQLVLALPILNQIHNKVLPLLGYNLNLGVCYSFKEALITNQYMLHTIYLDNNGLNDFEQATIFEGLQTQERIKCIVTKKNQFGEKSLDALKPLILKKNPLHLEELRIIDCQPQPQIISLLSFLTTNTNYLSKVSLVSVAFNEVSFKLLLTFIQEHHQLKDLSLAFNHFNKSDMIELLTVLSKDRKLTNLDLSYNEIWPPKSQDVLANLPGDDQLLNAALQQKGPLNKRLDNGQANNLKKFFKLSTAGALDQIQTQKAQLKRGATQIFRGNLTNLLKVDLLEDPEFDPVKKDIILKICSIIKYNTNLQHLNLQNTGLDSDLIFHIIDRALIKARSLLGIHLSNNPGITPKNIQFAIRRLKIRTKKPPVINFKDLEVLDAENNVDINAHETIKLKMVQRQVKATDHRFKFKQVDDRHFEFSRVLAHRREMPGSARWNLHFENRLSQQCWVCNQWIFTLVFWSRPIGLKRQIKGISSSQKDSVVQQIKQAYPNIEPFEKMNQPSENEIKLLHGVHILDDPNRPLLACESNNFRPTRMLRIEEYCVAINPKGQEQFNRLTFTNQFILKHQLRDSPFQTWVKLGFKRFLKKKALQFRNNWDQHLHEHLKYKRPFLVNSYNLKHATSDIDQLYVYPCFMRPGKHHYVVVQDDKIGAVQQQIRMPEALEKYFLHRDVIENRDEELPIFFKQLGQYTRERKFDHSKSVFRNWAPDSLSTYQKCLEHDFKYWKLAKFIKDPVEQELVKKVITDNFPKIKNIYHYMMSKSNYPGIGVLDFSNWTSAINLPDDKFIVSTIERAFIAAKNILEKIPGNTNSDNFIVRFQFLESLVRMANMKYCDPKIEKSISVALQRMLDHHVIGQDFSEEWQGFRTKKLWTIEVDDLLEPNIAGLQKVFNSYPTGQTSKQISMENMFSLYMRQTDLLSMEKDVMYCVGMSKMTYSNETFHADQFYLQVKFSEFLETIGRVAYFKYHQVNPDMPLAQMMERVLEDILATQGLKRIVKSGVSMDESESDKEY